MRSAVVLVALLGCGGDDNGGGGGGGTANPDDLIRACVIVQGCTGVENLTQCALGYGPNMSAAQVDCVIAAGGAACAAAWACLGFTYEVDPACVAGCRDDHTIVRCSGGVRAEYDCQTYIEDVGPTCVTGAQRSDCGGTSCTVDGEHTCAGSVSSTCDSGITEVVDCARFGLECVPTSRRCLGAAGGTCTAGSPATCDGDAIVECVDGVLHRADCSGRLAGLTCVIGGNGATCAFGSACTDGATCTGTTLDACVAGRSLAVDCTALGFSTCTSSGASGTRCM